MGLLALIGFFPVPALSRTVTQITPTITISEEYSDNYLKTPTDKQEEFITSFGLGFSVGFLNKRSEIYLTYNPEYKDYKNLDDRDRLLHRAGLEGEFRPTKFTTLNASIDYSGNTDDYAGESWQNSASLSGTTLLTQRTTLNYAQTYSRSFDQQERTGDYNEHDTSRTSAGIVHRFGPKDRVGLDFVYEFDDYAKTNPDEYEEYRPTAYLSYWFTPLNGFDTMLSYENTEFENDIDDIQTYSGHVRYVRKFSRRLDGYLKYRHSHSERDTGNHEIYHPSVGFDWDVTEDSGISLGVGLLFHEWDNDNDDSTEPFLDLNAYKIFNFSRRGSLTFTAASGYTESDENAASLGYTTYYQAAARLDYQLRKQMSSNLFTAYKLSDYQETAVDRKDNTLTVGGGLSWLPLKWLRFNLTYDYTDYNTDGDERGDYTENRAYFSVNFIPEQPVRIKESSTRRDFESEVFD